MSSQVRIGFNIDLFDAFWVEVREASYQRARELGFDLIPANTEDLPPFLSEEQQTALVEEILSQDFDALVGWSGYPEALAYRVLEAGLPIIHSSETQIVHPLSTSPVGLYQAAKMLSDHLVHALHGRGRSSS